jgi:hypothetical protein
MPNPAAGSVPFVFTDNATIVADVLNLWWNQAARQLSVGTAGDDTGTDTINTYFQQDSYAPNSQTVQGANSGSSAGHTVSSSRGTGQTPASSQQGDFIGRFTGWSFQSTPGIWKELAGLWAFAAASGTANNLGGELHLVTAADAGNAIDRITLDNQGNLFPTTVDSAALGKTGLGWSAFTLDGIFAAASGNVVVNKPSGTVQFAAAATTLTLSNSLIVAGKSLLFFQSLGNDATATFIKSCIISNGQAVLTLNAAATGVVVFGFLLVGN